jgi:hypothetical protein
VGHDGAVPRSNRPRRGGRPLGRDAPAGPARPLGGGLRRVEEHPDGEWVVQRVTGSGPAALEGRSYRCPGCDQLVPGGVPHVVAWPADGLLGAEAALADRRHWHGACWERRGTRGPRR